MSEEEREPVTVAELRGTDYFRKMEYQLSNAGIEIDLNSILNQYKAFDTSRACFIQAYIHRVKRGEDPNLIPINIMNGLVQVNNLALNLSGLINEMRK